MPYTNQVVGTCATLLVQSLLEGVAGCRRDTWRIEALTHVWVIPRSRRGSQPLKLGQVYEPWVWTTAGFGRDD